MEALPPKHLYTATIENTTDFDIKVISKSKVEGIEVNQTHEVKKGGSYTFPEQTYNKGTWTAVAPVEELIVETKDGKHKATIKEPFPNVQSPTKNMVFKVKFENEKLEIEAQ